MSRRKKPTHARDTTSNINVMHECNNKKGCQSHIIDDNTDNECLICTLDITDNPIICKKGLHKFHPECLYKYQTVVPKGRPACPNCNDEKYDPITDETRQILLSRIQADKERERVAAEHAYNEQYPMSAKRRQELEEDEERRRDYEERMLTEYGSRHRSRTRARRRTRTRSRTRAHSRRRSRTRTRRRT